MSNVNVAPGETNAGAGFVRVGAGDSICVFTSTSTDVVVDLTGTLEVGAGLAYVPVSVAPDDRHTLRRGWLGTGARWRPDTRRRGRARRCGRREWHAHARHADRPSFVAAAPCGPAGAQPVATSSINALAGDVVANALTVGVDGRPGVPHGARRRAHPVRRHRLVDRRLTATSGRSARAAVRPAVRGIAREEYSSAMASKSTKLDHLQAVPAVRGLQPQGAAGDREGGRRGHDDGRHGGRRTGPARPRGVHRARRSGVGEARRPQDRHARRRAPWSASCRCSITARAPPPSCATPTARCT